MKFVYACDIHGDKNKYEKLYKIAIEKQIHNIVLGGDLLPKFCHRDIEQPRFINEYLNDYFSKLRESNINCICILGNDDLEYLDEEFDNVCKNYSNIYNIDNVKVDIENISFIGLSKVLDHPFGCKDRVVMENNLQMQMQLSNKIFLNKKELPMSVDEWEEHRQNKLEYLENILDNLPKPSDNKKAIYVFHNPPYGIGLDVCMNVTQVGSKAMIGFLENSKAYMSLHGHIHESPIVSGLWYNKLGNTICIQPGQTEMENEELNYAIIDTEANEYNHYISNI